MGATGVSKVEEVKKYYCDVKCNDCELTVRLSSERELTEAQRDEVQERVLCRSCLKRKLDAKK